jgi:hypothetical protein
VLYRAAVDDVAVADGIITRSERGFVILDLDGDADETTAGRSSTLHLASLRDGWQPGRWSALAIRWASLPARAGYPMRRTCTLRGSYNGEWIPAHCHRCASGVPNSPFVMGGWTVRGWENQEYQGYMISGGEYRQAEQGRDTPINEVLVVNGG